MNNNKSDRSGNIIGGLILLSLGIWFLLATIGINMPDIGNMWPIFPTLGGLAFIAMFLFGRENELGVLVPGVGGFLVGLFFFFFTFGFFEWGQMGELWPVFPLIGGLAFLATFMADAGADKGLLVPAIGGIAVGIVGLLATLSGIGLAWIGSFWPVILILVGIGILAQNFLGKSFK